MSRWIKNDRTNTIQLLILIVGLVILAYWATVSLTAHNPLWFVSEFEGQPSRIVVYHTGQCTELLPGQAGFDELASAVQATLDQGFARLTSLGLSEPSLQGAYTQYVTLEVFFDQPVTLRSWFDAGRTTQMLFFITGRYAEMSAVLLGDQGEYRAGAPALKTMGPIQASLKSLGFY
jgi:hypothetical protein